METRRCPRCRAEGVAVDIFILDGYGVCKRCETTWNVGKNDAMIAIPEEI